MFLTGFIINLDFCLFGICTVIVHRMFYYSNAGIQNQRQTRNWN